MPRIGQIHAAYVVLCHYYVRLMEELVIQWDLVDWLQVLNVVLNVVLVRQIFRILQVLVELLSVILLQLLVEVQLVMFVICVLVVHAEELVDVMEQTVLVDLMELLDVVVVDLDVVEVK